MMLFPVSFLIVLIVSSCDDSLGVEKNVLEKVDTLDTQIVTKPVRIRFNHNSKDGGILFYYSISEHSDSLNWLDSVSPNFYLDTIGSVRINGSLSVYGSIIEDSMESLYARGIYTTIQELVIDFKGTEIFEGLNQFMPVSALDSSYIEVTTDSLVQKISMTDDRVLYSIKYSLMKIDSGYFFDMPIYINIITESDSAQDRTQIKLDGQLFFSQKPFADSI